jgi:uncharacterized protein (DUF1330 family)
MPNAYWIAHVDVSDPTGYQGYRAAIAESFEKYGARFLVRDGRAESVEGASRHRHVVVAFKDYETARACYRSPEYQKTLAFRRDAALIDFIAIAGYDGPQPSRPERPPVSAALGYWIGHVDVTEPEGYKAYMAADMAPIGQYGGRFLVRGGTFEQLEGSMRSRTVVLEFPSYDAALACYRSAEYQSAAALRKGKAEFDLVICEGYDGPQP